MSAEIKTDIVRYSKIEAGILEVKSKFEGVVYEVTSTAGMKDAKDARKVLKDLRIQVDKAREEEKAESLAYGRKVDAEAKRITSIIEPIEKSILMLIKVEEDRKEAEKQAKIEAERERLRLLAEQKLAEEKRIQEEALAEQRRLAEIEAKKQAEEAAKLKAERDALEAEKRKLEEERLQIQREQERIEAEKNAEIERKLKAEREAQEEAARLKKAEQDRIDAEKRRVEEEKRQAELAEKRRLEAIEAEKERIKLMKQNGYKILTEFCSKYINDEEFSVVVADINKFLASK